MWQGDLYHTNGGGKENSDEQKALLLCLFVCLLFDMILKQFKE